MFLNKFFNGTFSGNKNAPKQAATRKCKNNSLYIIAMESLLTVKATKFFHKETKTGMQLFSFSPFLLPI